MTELLTAQALRDHPLPDPEGASDKNSRGRVLVVAGSLTVPGAPILCGTASLRAGAGKAQLAVPQSTAVALGVAFPEAGVIPLGETDGGDPLPSAALAEAVGHADAVLVGPGVKDSKSAHDLAAQVLAEAGKGTILLDAVALQDAMTLADAIRGARGRVVLTPHHGEMAALLDIDRERVSAAPQHYATQVAEALNCTVVLKSATTFIAGAGQVWRHDKGCIGLATAGSGDVLAGLMAGFLARGASPITAAMWAVMVHAQAGHVLADRLGPVGFLARELLDLVPGLVGEFGKGQGEA